MSELTEKGAEFFKEFVGETEKHLFSVVEANKEHFPSWQKLLTRHQSATSRVWEKGVSSLNGFHEVHNELCIAVVILEDRTEPYLVTLDYEPSIEFCDKKFDFQALMSGGSTRYIEVKTIHPLTQDDWEKYQQALSDRRFPEDTHLILNREWLGGELYHNTYSARSKMLDNALTVEEKIESCLENTHDKVTFLAFFTNGFHWHIDELEDFIYFYRTGLHFPGDPFAKMERHVVETQDIKLKRSINHFAYFRRPKTEIRPNRVVWSVSAPRMPF